MDCSLLRGYLWYSTDVLRAVTEDNGEPLGVSEPARPPGSVSRHSGSGGDVCGGTFRLMADLSPLEGDHRAELITHQAVLCSTGICAIYWISVHCTNYVYKL